MSLKDIWKNKVDGVDDVLADDVNALASAIIENENDIKQAKTTSNEFIKKFSPVIEESASGESITIDDASEAPLLGLRVMGKTEQVKTSGKNMIPYPYYGGVSKTTNGITFAVNPDGCITINGTATADAIYTIYNYYGTISTNSLVPGKSYTLSSSAKGGTNTFFLQVAIKQNKTDGTSKTKFLQSYGSAVTYTIPDTFVSAQFTDIQIRVRSGYVANNVTIYPMFEQGSTASAYEPYTGGKPSPSPEYPQSLNTIANGGSISIDIGDEASERVQSINVSTPNGLPGVPLRSYTPEQEAIMIHKRNYVDSDGVSWVCDEIDLDRGVYVSRVWVGAVPSFFDVSEITNYQGVKFLEGLVVGMNVSDGGGLCEVARYVPWLDIYPESENTFTVVDEYDYGTDLSFVALADGFTVDSFREKFEGKPLMLIRRTPIETPLSDVEIEAYKALQTYKPVTNISNDEGAHMVVEYVADTKTYIDNKFAELQKAIINNA